MPCLPRRRRLSTLTRWPSWKHDLDGMAYRCGCVSIGSLLAKLGSTAGVQTPPAGRTLGRLGEVVGGAPVDGLRRETRLDPAGDLPGRASRCAAAAAAGYEVVHLALADVGLELCQRRSRIGPVEASDGHDGVIRRQLIARRVVGVDRGDHPFVLARLALKQRHQGRARPAAVQEAAAHPRTGPRRTWSGREAASTCRDAASTCRKRRGAYPRPALTPDRPRARTASGGTPRTAAPEPEGDGRTG